MHPPNNPSRIYSSGYTSSLLSLTAKIVTINRRGGRSLASGCEAEIGRNQAALGLHVRNCRSNYVMFSSGLQVRIGRGAKTGANVHRSQAVTGDTGRLSPQARSPPGDRGR